MADRDQHPSREDEIRHAVFGQVDLQTAELEIVSSIYDGFAAAITVKGQPRTIALTREYGDAVQLMAMIERGRSPQAAASEAGAAAGDPKGRRSIYDAAYDSIRKGAPGLSDATCAAISRSINLKVANGSASAEPGAIDEDWIRGLISEAVVMAEDQEREDESDEEICRIAESVLTAIRPYLRAQPQAREDAQPVAWRMIGRDGSTISLQAEPYHGGFAHMMESDVGCTVQPLYTHPAPDALREANLWWNAEDWEQTFNSLEDAYDEATGGEMRGVAKLGRATEHDPVWALRIDFDTTGDGEADDYEIRLFKSVDDAHAYLAALQAEQKGGSR
jgi:hypothetical protein